MTEANTSSSSVDATVAVSPHSLDVTATTTSSSIKKEDTVPETSPAPPSPQTTRKLRHDEQANEEYYDEREDADDDIEKGRIKFNPDRLYGRDEELRRLHAIFRRIQTTNAAQIVFLPGYSGTGKSSLVRHFLRQIRTGKDGNGGSNLFWYISGKFEELQSPDPFSAIAQGLNKFCWWLCQQEEKGTKSKEGGDNPTLRENVANIRKSLRDQIDPSEVQILTEIIPDLPKVMMGGGGGGVSSPPGIRSTSSLSLSTSASMFANLPCGMEIAPSSAILLALFSLRVSVMRWLRFLMVFSFP